MADYSFAIDRETLAHSIPGTGISLRAPGLRGTIEYTAKAAPMAALDLARAGGAPIDPLDQAVSQTSSLQSHDIETDAPTPDVAPVEGARAGVGELQDDELEVSYDAKPGEYSFVIYRDESGGLSFHFPQTPAASDASSKGVEPARSGVARTDTFRIQLRKPEPPPAEEGAKTRFGLVAIGKKLLKVVVGKIAKTVFEPVVGAAAYGAVWLWESTMRRFDGFHGGTNAAALLANTPAPFSEWNSLAGSGQQSLLFIHGTTSTTSGAFGGLNNFSAVANSLYSAYGNRVIGFNHHTLTKSVVQNVVDFHAALPQGGGPYNFDIICHSRGGLVARVLKEFSPEKISAILGTSWTPTASVNIGKIVFVGTPNIGTQLADPDDIPHALNQLANVASLFPGGGLEVGGIIACAAYAVEAGFKALPGLQDMDPGHNLLTLLNQAVLAGSPGPANDYYAVQSAFSAQGAILNAVMKTAMGYLFKGALNDLIVPTLGVSDIDGSSLASSRVLYYGQSPKADDVPHTGYFVRQETWDLVTSSLL